MQLLLFLHPAVPQTGNAGITEIPGDWALWRRCPKVEGKVFQIK